MKKKKSKRNKSPKIYRFIPDVFRKHASKFNRRKVFSAYRNALIVFTIFIFIVVIVVLGLDLHKNLQDREKLDFEREKITKELNFWQSFVAKHQDYRDAYLQLAILEYRLRDVNKARFYLNKSLAIDPNFEKGRELKKVLSSKY